MSLPMVLRNVMHFIFPQYPQAMRPIGPIEIAIVCEAGGAPHLQLRVHGSMTRAAWDAVWAAVDEAWRELRVSCTCGHAYALHGSRSPHACFAAHGDPYRSTCTCTNFQAASPVVITR